MMLLDEAIQHCDEKSKQCNECGREHAQLAVWLRELKQLRAEKADPWIPVSIKNPKYDGTYYCTVKVKEGIKGMQAGAVTGMECVFVNGIWKNDWFQEISHIFDVIAWYELPEPWEG